MSATRVELPWPIPPVNDPELLLHKSQVLPVLVVQLPFNPVQYFELAENLNDNAETKIHSSKHS
ncbi:hypothetical protein CLV96_1016 [Leptospira meyeri]|uniref:Uncharacterized protein n=1 Tax=Leptospira meyeri TaxID=29508 RepID=A0A4R8MYK2_LEPME|nr:hypothetical protein LEP1GSC017_2942 [Leptospira meyeri serovar Hardjo str. Went 5]TDY72036.1 hypothetical protein CLV96_1016 [Leptospira meyeri]